MEFLAADPWQAESMMQRLEVDSGHRRRNQRRRWAAQPWVRSVPPTAPNLRAQATLVIESFQDCRCQLFPYEPLRRDLLKLRVEEKSYGCRLVSPHDGEGHGDSFNAFSLALLLAHELAGKKTSVVGSLIDSPATTPLQRDLQRLQHDAELFQLDQEDFLRGEDHQAPLRELMYRIGRTNSRFR